MIASIKSASVDRVAQVYITDFSDVGIYPLDHRRENHTSLSRYFMDYGATDHLHSENVWETTKIVKRKKVLDEEGGIKVSQK